MVKRCEQIKNKFLASGAIIVNLPTRFELKLVAGIFLFFFHAYVRHLANERQVLRILLNRPKVTVKTWWLGGTDAIFAERLPNTTECPITS